MRRLSASGGKRGQRAGSGTSKSECVPPPLPFSPSFLPSGALVAWA